MKSFYTRRGDDGTTGLLGEGRLEKHDLRMETLGTLDEVSAVFGLVRSTAASTDIKQVVLEIQKQIYKLMGEVAATKETVEQFRVIDDSMIMWLEEKIDHFSSQIDIPKAFIIPGDSFGGAAMAMARTTVRRAERRISESLSRGDIENTAVLKYLNRLSSLCFVLEIYENKLSSKTQQTLAK
ncbi:MAG: ATP:cob(I)alamin adenosyltransferase [Anaerolineaceae bacterium]|nr:ATP:cob(I)alamin adenosyltransferase [Anaerolineaceae bacterium]